MMDANTIALGNLVLYSVIVLLTIAEFIRKVKASRAHTSNNVAKGGSTQVVESPLTPPHFLAQNLVFTLALIFFAVLTLFLFERLTTAFPDHLYATFESGISMILLFVCTTCLLASILFLHSSTERILLWLFIVAVTSFSIFRAYDYSFLSGIDIQLLCQPTLQGVSKVCQGYLDIGLELHRLILLCLSVAPVFAIAFVERLVLKDSSPFGTIVAALISFISILALWVAPQHMLFLTSQPATDNIMSQFGASIIFGQYGDWLMILHTASVVNAIAFVIWMLFSHSRKQIVQKPTHMFAVAIVTILATYVLEASFEVLVIEFGFILVVPTLLIAATFIKNAQVQQATDPRNATLSKGRPQYVVRRQKIAANSTQPTK